MKEWQKKDKKVKSLPRKAKDDKKAEKMPRDTTKKIIDAKAATGAFGGVYALASSILERRSKGSQSKGGKGYKEGE